jgi:hypothetical protein
MGIFSSKPSKKEVNAFGRGRVSGGRAAEAYAQQRAERAAAQSAARQIKAAKAAERAERLKAARAKAAARRKG